MKPAEKLERLALLVAIAAKLDVTPAEVHTYATALSLIQQAQDGDQDPLTFAQGYADGVADDPSGALDDAELVADMVNTIIQVKGVLV